LCLRFCDELGEHIAVGLGAIELAQGSTFLNEFGPSSDIGLQWATYFDASDASGFARLFGGIHPAADDIAGRNIGNLTGLGAWRRARQLFHGVPEPSTGALLAFGAIGFAGRRHRRGAVIRSNLSSQFTKRVPTELLDVVAS